MPKIVFHSPNLDRAIKKMLDTNDSYDLATQKTESFEPQKLDSEQQIFPETKAVSGEYNSFFKLVNASEISADGTIVYKVKVMDGMDRGHNRCKVNNKVFDIQDVTLTVTKTCLVVIRYTSSETKIEVMLTEDYILPDDTAQYSWYQIGEIGVGDGMVIRQDHLSGVAQMFWYDVCGD